MRTTERLPPQRSWVADRPGEIPGLRQPTGDGFGVPGPDQGYALKLAARFKDRLAPDPGGDLHDVIGGCLGVALKRAAVFGRAPVVYDLELAFRLWGFLGGAPDSLITFRRPLFAGVSHNYSAQRHIADLVPESTLRLTPAEVSERLHDWRSLLVPTS